MKTGLYYPLLLVSLWGILSGCGTQTTTTFSATAPCASGTAQIAVYDGFLKIICGCNEAAGTQSIPPATLTCTIPVNTLFTFSYLGTLTTHQIISEGTPSFAASPLSNPLARSPIRTHTVELKTAGTYVFKDALQSTLSGQLIVQ